jgi:DNA-directed RNA polymerase specialized sigma24 family protein
LAVRGIEYSIMSIESEKEEIRRLKYEHGLTLKQIADRFGKSIYWVNSRLDPKYEPKRKRKIAADDIELEIGTEHENLSEEVKQIVNLRKQGLSYEEIAREFGKSVYWVHTRLREKYRPKTKRKIAADDVDLDLPDDLEDENLSEEVRKIMDLRRQGFSYEKIADKLNRSVYWVHTRLRDEYRPKGSRAELQFQEERVIPFLKQIGHKGIRQFARVKGHGYSQEADVLSVYENSTWITEVKIDGSSLFRVGKS